MRLALASALALALTAGCGTLPGSPIPPEVRIQRAAATSRELLVLVENDEVRGQLVALLTALERAAGSLIETERLNWLEAALIVSEPLVADETLLDRDTRLTVAAVRATIVALLPYEPTPHTPSD